MLKYKGYTGHAEFDNEARVFHGEVLDLRDVITFQGTSVEELEREFRNSIELKIWISGSPLPIEKRFNKNLNIYLVQSVLAGYVLG